MKPLNYLILILALMGIFMMLEDAKAHEPYWVLRVTDDKTREYIWLRPFNRQFLCMEAREILTQYNKAAKIEAIVSCGELE